MRELILAKRESISERESRLEGLFYGGEEEVVFWGIVLVLGGLLGRGGRWVRASLFFFFFYWQCV